MGHPSAQLTKIYGKFTFCDDITDLHQYYLNDITSDKEIKELLIWRRLWNRIRKRKKEHLFWDYGAVALIENPIKRKWDWINVYLWKKMQYSIRH